MPKYRKKPKVVVAEQWFPGHIRDTVLVQGEPGAPDVVDAPYRLAWAEGHVGWMPVAAGGAFVQPGDYIVLDENGRRYPIRADLFDDMYELVVEE